MTANSSYLSTPSYEEKLKSILHQQEEQMRRGGDCAPSDIAFHSAIAEATQNRALIRLARVLIEIFAPSRDTFFQTRERAKKSLSFPKRILESIEGHPPVKAQ